LLDRESLDRTLFALADPTRRRVIDLLRKKPRKASALADALSITRPAMSRHLRVLRKSGLDVRSHVTDHFHRRRGCMLPDLGKVSRAKERVHMLDLHRYEPCLASFQCYRPDMHGSLCYVPRLVCHLCLHLQCHMNCRHASAGRAIRPPLLRWCSGLCSWILTCFAGPITPRGVRVDVLAVPQYALEFSTREHRRLIAVER